MGFLFSGVFWGVVIVIFGVSVIINVVFHVHIPVMRIFFGLILVYIGVQVIAGHRFSSSSNRTCCTENAVFQRNGQNEFSVVFGKGTIDLTETLRDASVKHFAIRTVFGESTVTIPSDVPVLVRAKSAFGGMNLPNGNTISFGEYAYKNRACTDQTNAAIVEIDLVFGGCTVLEK